MLELSESPTGKEKMLIHKLQGTVVELAPIERLRKSLNAEIEQGKIVRRWSYEIEANELGRAWEKLDRLGYELKNDGSVNERFEDCDCDTCNHDCNCSNCSWDSYDQERCDESQSTEATPRSSSKCLTADHEGKIAEACEALEDSGAYVDSSCGGHIHIDAQEMTPRQVANVMKAWDKIQEQLWVIVGRTYGEANGYADRVEAYDIDAVLSNNEANRCSVNPNNYLRHLRNSGVKNTIEFRQFSGTIDPELIMLRGLVCRKLVEHAERNLPLYYLLNATTPAQVLSELGL
jgi:hypothetical protein